MRKATWMACGAAMLASAMAGTAIAGEPQWIRQVGTSAGDHAMAVAVSPQSHVHVVGQTDGDLSTPAGGRDAFVVTFDAAGTELWRRQFGSAKDDYAWAVATDADGNVFVAGQTFGALAGANKGFYDAYLVKFDPDGHVLWKRQPGTPNQDEAVGVAAGPDGSVYLVGNTQDSIGRPQKGSDDAFVIKFDRDGHVLWKRQPGTSSYDYASGAATDADGNLYIAGYTSGDLLGPNRGSGDAFVMKVGADGHSLWRRQPGTPGIDVGVGVAAGDGGVFLLGRTADRLGGSHKGDLDAFLIRFDADGHYLWKRQPGTKEYDSPASVAVGADGSVHVAGLTWGPLGGPRKGSGDGYVITFDRNGRRGWHDQPGGAEGDEATGIAAGPDGAIYAVGQTDGSLGSPNRGDCDVFVIRYGPDGPE